MIRSPTGGRARPHLPAEQPNPGTSNVPYRVFNIGNHNPVPLMDFIGAIRGSPGLQGAERTCFAGTATCPATYADVDALTAGLASRRHRHPHRRRRFVAWYREYYRV